MGTPQAVYYHKWFIKATGILSACFGINIKNHYMHRKVGISKRQ